MVITGRISAADVVLDLEVGSKRSLLQMLAAEVASRLRRPEGEILDALRARERLGSTALGRGVALPTPGWPATTRR
jgi:PTS system nitrogen regulatory IIA component